MPLPYLYVNHLFKTTKLCDVVKPTAPKNKKNITSVQLKSLCGLVFRHNHVEMQQ